MVQAWSTFSRKNPNFTQDSISVPIHFYIFQPRYENMPKLWDMLCCNFSEVKYLGTIYNCNAPLFFSFEKWTFGLHCISSRCSMLLLLLLVAHCCTLLPLLQFWKKNRIGSVKKVSFPLFFFLFFEKRKENYDDKLAFFLPPTSTPQFFLNSNNFIITR